jgi:hypothetical protein
MCYKIASIHDCQDPHVRLHFLRVPAAPERQ